MALQTSGQISMSNIANEKGETLSNVSLSTLSTTSINTDSCNPTNPNNGAPYGISEFYGYDHSCVTGPSTFLVSMYGEYRDAETACFDQGGEFGDLFIMYSNCEADSLEPGCFIYADSAGSVPWPGDGWYYYQLRGTVMLISGGRIMEPILICKGGK